MYYFLEMLFAKLGLLNIPKTFVISMFTMISA